MMRIPSIRMSSGVHQIIAEARDSGLVLEVGRAASRLQAKHPDENIALEDIMELFVTKASELGVPLLMQRA